MNIAIINVLNWVSVVLGILTIPLNMYRKTVVWPISIASNMINLVIYYEKGGYSRIITTICTIPINLYGWYIWKWKKEKGASEKLITTTSGYTWLLVLLMNGVGSFILFLLLQYMASSTPVSGAITTMMTFIGLWLSAEKKLESSIFWGLYNLLSIYQHHWLGMKLKWKYIIYALLSPYTYYLWRTTYRKQKKEKKK